MSAYKWIQMICDTTDSERCQDLPDDEQVITLMATISQKPIAIYAQNPTIDKGFMNESSAYKICALLDEAMIRKIPVIALLSSPGISFDDQLASGKAYTEVIRRHIELQGKVPQIALLMGPVLGAPAYSAVLMDMIIFSQYRSYLMVTSPGVVQKAISEKTTMAALGGAAMHRNVTGLADFVLSKPEEQLKFARILLNYIQGDFKPEPPKAPLPTMPDQANIPFDISKLIEAVVDGSDYHEYKAGYGPSLICAFARLQGKAVGIIANQSTKQSGAINCDASEKAARFIRLCDNYQIPIITLIDVPGFMPGKFEEQKGLLKYGADFCRAMQTKVLRMSVVVRRCYGAAAFLLMQTKAQKGQVSLALETAQLGVMGQQSLETFQSNRHQTQPTLTYAQQLGLFDEIIKPEDIRTKLIYYLLKHCQR